MVVGRENGAAGFCECTITSYIWIYGLGLVGMKGWDQNINERNDLTKRSKMFEPLGKEIQA